ncbi:hypothetical protein C8F01DRAFT_1368638 [Mycena amicta]|nr:hypothetical protein C8F01DRAFT_1368638 [Mycena amicta]
MADDYACPFCTARPKTSGGLRSHYSQRVACRVQLEALVAAEHAALYEDSDSDAPLSDTEMLSERDPMDLDGPEEGLTPPAIDGGDDVPNESDADADMDDPDVDRWGEEYPDPAGCVLEDEGDVKTEFQALREQQEALGLPPWDPFESRADWELAKWLVESGVSRTKIDELFKLDATKAAGVGSYHIRKTGIP